MGEAWRESLPEDLLPVEQVYPWLTSRGRVLANSTLSDWNEGNGMRWQGQQFVRGEEREIQFIYPPYELQLCICIGAGTVELVLLRVPQNMNGIEPFPSPCAWVQLNFRILCIPDLGTIYPSSATY